MALNMNFAVMNYILDLEGEVSGHLAGADIGSIKVGAVTPPSVRTPHQEGDR